MENFWLPRPSTTNFPTIWWQLAVGTGPLGRLVASPLGIGWIDLDDGSRVQGFRQAAAFRLGCVGRKVRFVRSFGVHTLVPDQYVWRIALAHWKVDQHTLHGWYRNDDTGEYV